MTTEESIPAYVERLNLLIYWINERHKILRRRQAGLPKPWSEDPVMRGVYFCNVHREDDTVTKFIRKMYSPYVEHDYFEYNIILSRFFNFPPTLEALGYQVDHDPRTMFDIINQIQGKKWGNAYVVTTCGVKGDKLTYVLEEVMGRVDSALWRIKEAAATHNCKATARVLEAIDGIGPFLTGQIIADLKNTNLHPLSDADDWASFVIHGPGSLRGLEWVMQTRITPRNFYIMFDMLRDKLFGRLDTEVGPLCAQDLQNCLCEFDKYMRVKNGTGRSKRLYNGYK
jgi:hypothetical protein